MNLFEFIVLGIRTAAAGQLRPRTLESYRNAWKTEALAATNLSTVPNRFRTRTCKLLILKRATPEFSVGPSGLAPGGWSLVRFIALIRFAPDSKANLPQAEGSKSSRLTAPPARGTVHIVEAGTGLAVRLQGVSSLLE